MNFWSTNECDTPNHANEICDKRPLIVELTTVVRMVDVYGSPRHAHMKLMYSITSLSNANVVYGHGEMSGCGWSEARQHKSCTSKL